MVEEDAKEWLSFFLFTNKYPHKVEHFQTINVFKDFIDFYLQDVQSCDVIVSPTSNIEFLF